MNLWGAVEGTVLRGAEESSLQKVIRLIRDAQQQKAPAQRFTDQFSSVYTYVALGVTVAMFFVWWLAMDLSPFSQTGGRPSAFYRAMTLLVVASPCALVLSIPSAVLAAIAWGARHGVLFRGGAAVEKLAGITTVALDKTGTLTTGELRVERVESFPPGREPEVAILACSLEKLSSHPLARAITLYGKHQQLPVKELDHVESVTGEGLKATYRGAPILLGKRSWLKTLGADLPEGISEGTHNSTPALGSSEVWLAASDLFGRITLRDDIRAESRVVLDALRAEGVRTLMLTGDHASSAEHVRAQLHLDEVKPTEAGQKLRKSR